MNISEKGGNLIKKTNVYSACNGEYRRGQRMDRKYINESKDHELIQTKKGDNIVIDEKANDLDKVFLTEGRTIPPDEILDLLKPDNLKLPMKLRDDFERPSELPGSDLLKVIHYFVSKKFDKVLDKNGGKRMIQSLDETALIAMGLLLESWCDELITDEVAKLFTKEYAEDEPDILDSENNLEEDDDDGVSDAEEDIVSSSEDM